MKSRAPSRQKRKVLIDTGAFYAFADASDAHHRESVAVFTDLRDKRDYLLTTSFIVAETHALLLNRLNREAAIQFLKDTEEETHISVIWVTPPMLRRREKSSIATRTKAFPLPTP